MLCLSRKMGEIVRIGSDIQVVVIGIKKGVVQLGFAAPPEVPVWREELLARKEVSQSSGS
jgi:carbon storage regulator